MKYLQDYGFTLEEINEFSENIPALLLEKLLSSYRLVSKNLDYLKSIGVQNYKDIFKKYYDMFLMDNSNFIGVFNEYDREDLVAKLNDNIEIVEFL